MPTFSQRRQKRKQELKHQNIEARNERLRLKALPEVLRRLETELGNYVDFMEVYDGYSGDLTGQIIPANPVGNPFAVIYEMNLNFPHPNSLNIEQKKIFIDNLEKAFNRMMFNFNSYGLSDTELSQLYHLLLYHIMTPDNHIFDIFISANYEGITLTVKRFNFDYLY